MLPEESALRAAIIADPDADLPRLDAKVKRGGSALDLLADPPWCRTPGESV